MLFRLFEFIPKSGSRLLGALVIALCMTGCQSVGARSFPSPFSSDACTQSPEEAAVEQAWLAQFWENWALENLQEGDIVFRMGVSRVALGLFDVSKFSAKMADSNYSHAGILAIENGRAYVYDTTRQNAVGRNGFSDFVLKYGLAFGVKRLHPEYASAISDAIQYCREAQTRCVPFDRDFQLGDERLYCTELIELAYRSGGVKLSDPVRLDALPRYDEHPALTRLIGCTSEMVPEQRFYLPGNDEIGIWSSPKLETIIVQPGTAIAVPMPVDNPLGTSRAVSRRRLSIVE